MKRKKLGLDGITRDEMGRSTRGQGFKDLKVQVLEEVASQQIGIPLRLRSEWTFGAEGWKRLR